jgi:hypothetical protein
MSFDFPIYIESTVNGNHWRVVDAEVAEVAEHLWPWTWAVHRHPVIPDAWSVSNIETGLGVDVYEPTKVSAELRATAKLASRTVADMERAIAAHFGRETFTNPAMPCR